MALRRAGTTTGTRATGLRSGAADGSSRPPTQSARSLICMADASAMSTPPIFDDRAGPLSRVPAHSGQVANVAARSTKAGTCGRSPSTSSDSIDFWIRGISPS